MERAMRHLTAGGTLVLLQLAFGPTASRADDPVVAKPIVVEAKDGGRTSYWLESSLKRVFPATPPGSATLEHPRRAERPGLLPGVRPQRPRPAARHRMHRHRRRRPQAPRALGRHRAGAAPHAPDRPGRARRCGAHPRHGARPAHAPDAGDRRLLREPILLDHAEHPRRRQARPPQVDRAPGAEERRRARRSAGRSSR